MRWDSRASASPATIAVDASHTEWRSTTPTAWSVSRCSTSLRRATCFVAPTPPALRYWPWALLSQPGSLPERLIAADPEAIVDDALGAWGSERDSFPSAIRAAYVDALRNPESIRAICEEYRAAATIDDALDVQDRAANRRIGCPTRVLWSEGSGLDTWYAAAGGPLGLWREWAADVSGRAIRGGHFFPEQNAEDTIADLRAFFAPA